MQQIPLPEPPARCRSAFAADAPSTFGSAGRDDNEGLGYVVEVYYPTHNVDSNRYNLRYYRQISPR